MSANWSLRLANAVSKWTPGPRDQEDGGYYRPAQPFSELSAYKSILHHRRIAERHGIETPFFRTHEGHRGTHTFIAGKEYLNYAWCDLSVVECFETICGVT